MEEMPMTPPEGYSTFMTMDHMMPMQMSFYWGSRAVVLFSGWPDDSPGMYVLAILFVLLLAAGVEVLAAFPTPKRGGANPIAGALGQAVPYAVRMGLAYLVMLSVMSFNGGIFVAAVVGHFLGFFLVKARALAVANRSVEAGLPDGEAPPSKV